MVFSTSGFDDLTKTFCYGASLIRRTFYGKERLSSNGSESPGTPGSNGAPPQRINLVERVQALGVDRLVGPSGGPMMAVGGVVTPRPVSTSPLLQLSSLIMSSARTDSEVTTTTTTIASATASAISEGGIMSTPKIMSPGTRKPRPPAGAPMGVPGTPGSGHLDNRLNQLKPGQRSDLGTVCSRARPTSLGTVPGRGKPSDTKMGTVGWTSLGRKGGLM